MSFGVKKSKSKRGTTRLREGIKKKIAAHNRKQRKLAKKDPTWKSRHSKDPGIPMSFPLRDQILEDIETKKREDLELKAQRREERRQQLLAQGANEEETDQFLDNEEQADNSNRLAALLESAQAAAAEYDGEVEDGDDDEMEVEEDDEIRIEIEDNGSKDSSRKAFDKIYKAVVDRSDVILYVLDARDPDGTRSHVVEQAVLSKPDKRLLFVLNKIDLVSDKVLKQWHNVLKLQFPTLPLAASSAAPNARTFIHKGLTQQSTASALVGALKAYANKSNLKRAITVGVVGYPNVGKSSVINAVLTRHGGKRTACPVGAQAGITTTIRQIKVDSKLKVLDSPGVVFPSSESSTSASKKKSDPVDEQSRLVLLNALPPKQIDDPVPAVSLLLKRLLSDPELKSYLQVSYGLTPLLDVSFNSLVTDFLVQVARKKGRLGKGGIPDLKGAAHAIIVDWRDGRITGWTSPKQNTTDILQSQAEKAKAKEAIVIKPTASKPVEEKMVVTEWAAEFSLDGLWDGNFGGDEETNDVEMS